MHSTSTELGEPSPLEPVPGVAQPKTNVRKTLDTRYTDRCAGPRWRNGHPGADHSALRMAKTFYLSVALLSAAISKGLA